MKFANTLGMSTLIQNKRLTPAIIGWLFFLSFSLFVQTSLYANHEFFAWNLGWAFTLPIYISSILLLTLNKPINDEKIALMVPFALLPFFLPFSLQISHNLVLVILALINLFFFSLLCHLSLWGWVKRAPLSPATALCSVLGIGAAVVVAFFLPNLTTPFFAFTLIACSLFRAESKAAFYRSPVNRYDFAYPIFMGLCLYGLGNLSPMLHVYAPSHDKLIPFVLIFTYVVLSIVGCYLFHERPIRFSLGLLVIYAISTIIPLKGSLPFDPNMLILIGAISLILALKNHVLFSASTAFGKISVIDHPDLNVHLLKNGSIVHGVQFWDPARRGEPLAYYNRKGPIGDVFSRLGLASATNIGVVGLGAGTLAAYGTKGQTFTFFEINPFVVDLAQNPNYFTYLHDSPAQINCITGEGRDHISKAAPGTFDALFIDGYHADYTPLELYTAEAVETYLNALTENGILVFHISSSTTAIQAALAKIAETLNLKGAFRRDSADSRMHSTEVSVTPRGLIAFNKSQTPAINDRVKLYMDYIDDFLTRCGILKTPQGATTPYLHLDSEWVVMSRSVEMIEPVIKECQWHELHTLKDLPLLTDKSILQAAIIKMYREAFELVVATP